MKVLLSIIIIHMIKIAKKKKYKCVEVFFHKKSLLLNCWQLRLAKGEKMGAHFYAALNLRFKSSSVNLNAFFEVRPPRRPKFPAISSYLRHRSKIFCLPEKITRKNAYLLNFGYDLYAEWYKVQKLPLNKPILDSKSGLIIYSGRRFMWPPRDRPFLVLIISGGLKNPNFPQN